MNSLLSLSTRAPTWPFEMIEHDVQIGTTGGYFYLAVPMTRTSSRILMSYVLALRHSSLDMLVWTSLETSSSSQII